MARGPADIVRLTSTVRAVEAAGGAVASGLSSTSAPVSEHDRLEGMQLTFVTDQLISAVGVNFGLWGLAVVPTYLVARTIGLE